MAGAKVALLTDDKKQVLLDRYSELEWCDDANEFLCVRCGRVAIYHYLSNCKHLFCLNCKNILNPTNDNQPTWNCPLCEQELQQLDEQSWEIEEKVYELMVCCPNKKYGCNYSNKLKHISEHLSSCENTREAALPVESKNINLEAIFWQISKMNDRIGDTRKELTNGLVTVDTQLKDIGEQLKNRTKAEDVVKQLQPGIKQINEQFTLVHYKIISMIEDYKTKSDIAKNIGDLQENLYNLHSRLDDMEKKRNKRENQKATPVRPMIVYNWDITNFEEALNSKKIIYSVVFPLPGFHFGAKVCIYLNGEYSVWFNLQFVNYNNNNLAISVFPLTMFTFIITDQVEHNDDILLTSHVEFGEVIRYEKELYSTSNADIDLIKHGNYIKDDSIRIQILMEPPSASRHFQSNDGTLLWKLENYSDNKKKESKGLISGNESPYFYTSPRGYRVKLNLHLKFGRLDVYLVFLNGEFDHLLSDDYAHTTTVTVCNEQEELHLVKSVTSDKPLKDYITFGHFAFKEEDGFVKDNCLTIEVIVISN